MTLIQPLLFRLLGRRWKVISFARQVVFLAHSVSLQNGMHSPWLHSSGDERRRAHIIFILLYLDCRVGFFFSWDDLWLRGRITRFPFFVTTQVAGRLGRGYLWNRRMWAIAVES